MTSKARLRRVVVGLTTESIAAHPHVIPLGPEQSVVEFFSRSAWDTKSNARIRIQHIYYADILAGAV